jgi:hypothetical protein
VVAAAAPQDTPPPNHWQRPYPVTKAAEATTAPSGKRAEGPEAKPRSG